jgi:hypothetical protein
MRNGSIGYVLGMVAVLAAGGCGDDAAATADGGASSGDDAAVVDGGTASPDATPVDCSSATTQIEKVVCASEAFEATLSDSEKATLLYDFTDATAKTTWSNLPGVTRNGLEFSNLSATSLAAAKALAETVLSADGYADFTGVLAADDYLNSQGSGGGPGGGAYGSGNYYVAFIGTPSTTGDWMLQLGGHHMAFNITYVGGVGYPVPNHLGVEPKASFTVDSETFEPMGEEGAAISGIFTGMSSAELASAYLSGQTFADVLIGPDNGSGAQPDDYPTGTNRKGVLVSSLSSAKQALVTAAIRQWVADYGSDIADPLMADYTTASAYADTYVAWGGTQASGPDVDVGGTYFRIDGPRLWIEVACQNGVVIQGKTHYHSVFRDKAMDYGDSL